MVNRYLCKIPLPLLAAVLAGVLHGSAVAGPGDDNGAQPPGNPATAPSPAGPAATVTDHAPPAGAPAPAPQARARHHARPNAAKALDDHVRALTKELDLDQHQQAKVREALVKERVAILSLRKGAAQGGQGAQDIVAASHAIMMRTRGEIRGLLNEEQRKKYFVDVPQDKLAPAQADVNFWLEATRPKAQDTPQGPVLAPAVPAAK